MPGSQPSRPDNDNDFDLENYDDFDQDNDDDFDQDDDDGDNFYQEDNIGALTYTAPHLFSCCLHHKKHPSGNPELEMIRVKDFDQSLSLKHYC